MMTNIAIPAWLGHIIGQKPVDRRSMPRKPVEIDPSIEIWPEHLKEDFLDLNLTPDVSEKSLETIKVSSPDGKSPEGLLVTEEFRGEHYQQLANTVKTQLAQTLGKKPVSLLLRTGGHGLGFSFEKLSDSLGIEVRQIKEPTAFTVTRDQIVEEVHADSHDGESADWWSLPYARKPLGAEVKDETKFLLQEYPHLKEMLVRTEWMVKDTRDCPEKSWRAGSKENHYPYHVYYMEIWPTNSIPEKSVRGSRQAGLAEIAEQHHAMREGTPVH